MVQKHYQMHLPWAKNGTSHLKAGAFRRKEAVHEAIKRALNECALPREDVAKELSRLVGEDISVNTLNNWCAEGKTNRRFPLECVLAIVTITGDTRIVRAAIEPEYTIVSEDERACLEYGRMLIEDRKRAQRKRQLQELAEKAGA